MHKAELYKFGSKYKLKRYDESGSYYGSLTFNSKQEALNFTKGKFKLTVSPSAKDSNFVQVYKKFAKRNSKVC